MFQTQHPVVPPYYMPQDYRTPPHTPAPGVGHGYFSPRQYSYPTATTPKPGHTRRATQDYSTTYKTTYTTTSPRKPYYDPEPERSSPGYYSSAYSTPKHRPDYVSDYNQQYAGARYSYRVPAAKDSRKPRRHFSSKHHSSPRSPYVYDGVDYDYEYLPRYEKSPTRPPPYEQHQSYHHGARADHYPTGQVPTYTPAEPTSRPRRASGTSKPTYASQPPRPRTSNSTKPPAEATEEDARRAGIPAGYSYKNWDPTEEPILLLGSVFDANSLGKWIYDWTVFFFGPAAPMTEIAGELWLLLIQLAGKIKRAEDTMSRIRQTKSRELVDEFLDSGERLWQRFNKLLKICENYMWKAAKKESRDAKKVTMGKNSGCEFVDAIFGRDRELERTEKLMTGIRLWSMRFDANVGPILAAPHQ
jgi:hypothetical protein